MVSTFSKEEIQTDFEALDAEFEGLGLADADLASDDFDLLSDLEAEAREAGLLDDDFEELSFSTLANDAADMAFFGGWIKRKAKKIVNRVLSLARKYGPRCKSVIPLVAAAVALIKAGKWIAAIRAGYKAAKALKRCAAG